MSAAVGAIESVTVRTGDVPGMSEEETEEEAEEPAVELGEGADVEGAPIARVAARLTWPKERSLIAEREGDATIRTPGGPRILGDVLEETDTTYFDTRQSFVEAIEGVVGRGPIEAGDEE
jgi:hypothetical protein